MKKLLFLLFIPLFLLLSPAYSHADNFPNDAIQLNFTQPANSGTILLTSGTTRTILYVVENNYVNGDAYLTDDSNGFLLADASAVIRQDTRWGHYITSGQIVSHNSGTSGNSTGQIIYLNYDITSVVNNNTSTKEFITASGGNFYLTKEINYGEILIITFLLLFTIVYMIKLLWNFIKQDTNQKI